MQPHNLTDEELLREARDSMDPMVIELAKRFSVIDEVRRQAFADGHEVGYEKGWEEGYEAGEQADV